LLKCTTILLTSLRCDSDLYTVDPWPIDLFIVHKITSSVGSRYIIFNWIKCSFISPFKVDHFIIFIHPCFICIIFSSFHCLFYKAEIWGGFTRTHSSSSLHRHLSLTPDPPENCHLNVKKLRQNCLFSPKICHWHVCEKWHFLAIFLKKMSSFCPYFVYSNVNFLKGQTVIKFSIISDFFLHSQCFLWMIIAGSCH